nr:putative Na+/H+ antiporter [Verrucomicrobiota bacterium]
SRPVLRLAESCLSKVASLGGGTPAAWWVSILTAGPILGSFITEPAAMTICALLLSSRFYALNPSMPLRYATLGLLFVNISVGGTLTHFAAPPVVMVATTWNWDSGYMLTHFGWKAIVGILVANAIYFVKFRRELRQMFSGDEAVQIKERPVPVWITIVHVFFIGWSVLNAHYLSLVVLGFLFFLAFVEATERHQAPINLRSPMMVGFFLAAIVIHGGGQQWWIAPVLSSLGAWPLMIGATLLTAVNDNAAITYLASLVPGFSEELKYAVVAGAVTGGGLTVIANAPNPAGQSILAQCFGEEGVSPAKLFVAALIPTLVVGAAFMLLPA